MRGRRAAMLWCDGARGQAGACAGQASTLALCPHSSTPPAQAGPCGQTFQHVGVAPASRAPKACQALCGGKTKTGGLARRSAVQLRRAALPAAGPASHAHGPDLVVIEDLQNALPARLNVLQPGGAGQTGQAGQQLGVAGQAGASAAGRAGGQVGRRWAGAGTAGKHGAAASPSAPPCPPSSTGLRGAPRVADGWRPRPRIGHTPLCTPREEGRQGAHEPQVRPCRPAVAAAARPPH